MEELKQLGRYGIACLPDSGAMGIVYEGLDTSPNYSVALEGASKNSHFIPTAALRKKFLAYISYICGAAIFFTRLAFGRTLNFRGALKTIIKSAPADSEQLANVSAV